VASERGPNEFTSFLGQRYQARPPILRVVRALHQTPVRQTVYGRGHRSAGETYFMADGVHCQWSFMKENLQDLKIREAHPGFRNAGESFPFEGSEGFHQYQPKAQFLGGAGFFNHMALRFKILEIK
jgi:hypothetical protein